MTKNHLKQNFPTKQNSKRVYWITVANSKHHACTVTEDFSEPLTRGAHLSERPPGGLLGHSTILWRDTLTPGACVPRCFLPCSVPVHSHSCWNVSWSLWIKPSPIPCGGLHLSVCGGGFLISLTALPARLTVI